MQQKMNKEKATPRWLVEGGGVKLELGHRTLVMGILNVTPDSFSDGGRFISVGHAIEQARLMAAQGADLIDVGGESSRPGSEPISAEEELRRVIPVIEQIARSVEVPISIDTNKAVVARAAILSGAGIINDISALRQDPQMAGLAAELGVPVILMHRQGTSLTMQDNPLYQSVVSEINYFFEERMAFAQEAGIRLERIILDPGIGFGKNLSQNLEIIGSLDQFNCLDRPLLLGPSRKSFLGQILGLPAKERLEGTIAASVTAVLKGASILRVHDVEAISRAIKVADAIRMEAQ